MQSSIKLNDFIENISQIIWTLVVQIFLMMLIHLIRNYAETHLKQTANTHVWWIFEIVELIQRAIPFYQWEAAELIFTRG